MDFGMDMMLLKEMSKDSGVAGGNLLAVEPLYSLVVDLFGNGQREAAF